MQLLLTDVTAREIVSHLMKSVTPSAHFGHRLASDGPHWKVPDGIDGGTVTSNRLGMPNLSDCTSKVATDSPLLPAEKR
jgi:hypothetical protein